MFLIFIINSFKYWNIMIKKYKITESQFHLLEKYSKYKGNILFESADDFDPLSYPDDIDTGDISNSCLLSFSSSNAKISHPYFSLPAGYTCPFAKLCKSTADRETGKIKDTKDTEFRCYAASQEAIYKNTRNSRWRNFDLLKEAKTKDGMYKLIKDSLEYNLPTANLIRIHESGDFFNQEYFDAWLQVAKEKPSTTFYAYTKAIPYWVARIGSIPKNFKLNASKGGRYDSLIDNYNLKYAEVVFSVEEAKQKGLYIDKDDKLAWAQDKPFAILLHGTQPAGSEASKALSALKKQGFTGYSSKKKR
jgi:hypothetical protein